jgi:hypothetical protein
MAICARPDMAAFRSILVRHLLLCYEDEIPKMEDYIPLSRRSKTGIQDTPWRSAWFIGNGIPYDLSNEETKHMEIFLRKEGQDIAEIQQVFKFQRALYQTEIHSKEYSRVLTRCSANVAINYSTSHGERIYYGTVLKFFLVQFEDDTEFRVALVSCYLNLQNTRNGTPRVNRNSVYKTGRIIHLDTIKTKVIFFGDNPAATVILPTPLHFSNTELYEVDDLDADED